MKTRLSVFFRVSVYLARNHIATLVAAVLWITEALPLSSSCCCFTLA
jgi:hypothetical protein